MAKKKAKKQIRVSVDVELIEEAKALGLDLAKTCELAIIRGVAALRALEGMDDLEAA